MFICRTEFFLFVVYVNDDLKYHLHNVFVCGFSATYIDMDDGKLFAYVG